MNEPYEHVHVQSDSNNTLGTMAKHVGFGVAATAATEASFVAGAKFIKQPEIRQMLQSTAYSRSDSSNKFVRAFGSGMATRPGRMFNYGTAIAGGLITGAMSSSVSK